MEFIYKYGSYLPKAYIHFTITDLYDSYSNGYSSQNRDLQTCNLKMISWDVYLYGLARIQTSRKRAQIGDGLCNARLNIFQSMFDCLPRCTS